MTLGRSLVTGDNERRVEAPPALLVEAAFPLFARIAACAAAWLSRRISPPPAECSWPTRPEGVVASAIGVRPLSVRRPEKLRSEPREAVPVSLSLSFGLAACVAA